MNENGRYAAEVGHIDLNDVACQTGGYSGIDGVASGLEDLGGHASDFRMPSDYCPTLTDEGRTHGMWRWIDAGNEATPHSTSTLVDRHPFLRVPADA